MCWSWTTPWVSWCFGVFPRLGWTLGALWRISRRLLDVFFLRSWLRGARWRRRFWRRWNVRRRRKRCRRSMLFFVVGFLVGFVGPLAGVGGGVLFTPLAVGLLGVDVNLARTGGLLVSMTTSSVAGSFQAGGCLGLWLMRGRLCRLARFWGRVLACFWRGLRGAGGGGGGAWGSLVVFVLLGRRVEWPPRRVDGLAVWLGFVGGGCRR